MKRVYEESVEGVGKRVGVWGSVRSGGGSVKGGVGECGGKCVGVWGKVRRNVERSVVEGVKECME